MRSDSGVPTQSGRKVIWTILVLGLAVLVCGCMETEQEFTLNPDGSGKMVIEATFALMLMGREAQDPEAQMKATVKQILEKSSGADAWKDVAFKLTDDGKTWFKGTAYFKDISKLDMRNIGQTNVTFSKNEPGTMVLTLKVGDKGGPEPTPIEMTEEEIAKKIKAEKAGYQQAKSMMASFLGAARMKMSFQLPGTLGKVTNFTKDATGAVGVTVEGAKLIAILDELMADDAWIREQVLAGRNINRDGPPTLTLNEKLFGAKAPIQAIVTGDLKPLFDYPAEVAQAQKEFPKILEKLETPKPTPPKPDAPVEEEEVEEELEEDEEDEEDDE